MAREFKAEHRELIDQKENLGRDGSIRAGMDHSIVHRYGRVAMMTPLTLRIHPDTFQHLAGRRQKASVFVY